MALDAKKRHSFDFQRLRACMTRRYDDSLVITHYEIIDFAFNGLFLA